MQKFALTLATTADAITKTVKPIQGGTVAIYQAGTNTLAALYQDNETASKTNPLISDSQGLVECKLPNGSYDVVLAFGSVFQTIRGFYAYDGATSSVAITMPGQYSVSGGVNVSWLPQTAKTFLAGPATGSAAAPGFRQITEGDLPAATTSSKGIVALADAATVLAKSDTSKAPSAATMGNHLGVAKAWVIYQQSASTPTILDSFNVASVVTNGGNIADQTVYFDVPFATDKYVVQGTGENKITAPNECEVSVALGGRSAGSCRVVTRYNSGGAGLTTVMLVFFGKQ